MADLVTHFSPEAPFFLDVGCGCGKLARFLHINPKLRYIGIDLFLPSIEWCRKAFEPITGARFRFEHFNGYSESYNQREMWTQLLINFRRRRTRWTQLCALLCSPTYVCASLFTHLNEPACTHYLNEIARVLKSGGRAILSIHTQPAAGAVFSGTEARIDIEPKYFVKLALAAGLSFFQSPGVVYGQSTLVFEKH